MDGDDKPCALLGFLVLKVWSPEIRSIISLWDLVRNVNSWFSIPPLPHYRLKTSGVGSQGGPDDPEV